MTVSIDPAWIADLVMANPWPTIVFIFLIGVVLPAAWIPSRRDAAMAVLVVVLTATIDVVSALRGDKAGPR